MKKRTPDAPETPAAVDSDGRPAAVIPVIEEVLQVEKRKVVTGKVRVTKEVQEEQAVVDEPLEAERVEIERVSVNRPVNSAPQPRQEGDTLIIPVVEEVLVKRLVLKEEVRVRRVRETRSSPQKVTLRREEVHVERSKDEEDEKAR